MGELLNIDSVASSKNLGGLRQLYDTIETHIRSLCSLGVPSKSYGMATGMAQQSDPCMAVSAASAAHKV